MSTIIARSQTQRPAAVPLLHNGDHLTQPEFHRRYEAYPGKEKFELIGGIVYMSSPLRMPHSDYDDEVGFALGLYRRATPGVQVLHNASVILSLTSEPQPDLALRIVPEFGGQSGDTPDQYIAGPPELLIEIAYSTWAIDMHQKKLDYQRAGVLEYVVVCIEDQELHWFNFKTGRPIRPDAQGIYRSRVFPGLWIDGPALLARKSARIARIVRQGLKSPEHAAFVKRLQAAFRRRSQS
jgi:Uma2 family endonuclease